MAKTKDCVHVSCDHCGCGEYYTSLQYAENIGWEFDILIDDDERDLCPKCSNKWHDLIRNFLYGNTDEDYRIKKALEVAYKHGQADGAHHKAWVIDQMLRRLLGDDYDEWIKRYKYDDETGDEYDWDEGIAP